MKMFDYMACGRAIISSDLPVIHEVLNAANAVFCPPEAPEPWAQALAALLADPARRLALGRQAAQDVTRYTWLARARRALEGF
jgi:glycosyltransferase involved in cell wall biosynthesis